MIARRAVRRLLVPCLTLSSISLSQSPAASPVPAPAMRPAAAVPAPSSAPVGGVGDLLVAPTRVVFEARVRSAEVSLINLSRQTATYRISFTHLRMTEDGELKEIEKPEEGAPFADDLIRYSPREVTLDPNVAQVIRMQLRLPASLPSGEYRSHLLMRAVPPETVAPERNIENLGNEKPPTGLTIQLTPIYGVSIPVIVRHGGATATSSLSQASFRQARGDEPALLEFRLDRSGATSTYGNLTVTFVPASGRSVVVGSLNGVAVYTPNPFRLIRIPLQPPPAVALAHGRLEVVFSRAEANGERLAQTTVALP